jgi:hypothetical protein
MILTDGGEIIDIDLSLTLSVLKLLDEKAELVYSQASDFNQHDNLGVLDELEHLMGFGIVGVQTYITDIASFADFPKHETFRFGPTTASGTSKVQIINAVANYWKHRSEWELNGGGKRQEAIEKLFDEVGYSTETDYPVSGILTEILTPLDTRLSNLSHILIEWRNGVFSDPQAKNRRG